MKIAQNFTPKSNPNNRLRGFSLGMFAADLGNLKSAAREAVSWGCDILHFDIMDGVFVPQMSGGPGFVKALNGHALMDVHLMVEDPSQHVVSYVEAGADMITIHAESKNAAEAITLTRDAAARAERPVLVGLGIMPGTSLEEIAPLLALELDMIVVLSLDPRNGIPADITTACARVSELQARFGTSGPILAFDGGVTLNSIDEIAACSPDMIVSGSAVLKAEDPKAAFEQMTRA